MLTELPPIHHYGSRPGYKTPKAKSDLQKLNDSLKSSKNYTVTVEKEALLTILNAMMKYGKQS